ncbi:MAG: magnesium transporter [Acidimicrobiales bacterium]
MARLRRHDDDRAEARSLSERLGGSEATESFVALGLLAVTAVVAGVVLGQSTGELEELPGLLLMVPAAIALRGNIFGALGSRLGTAIHAGTYRLSLRPGTVVGENVIASMVLTLLLSFVLAILAKATAVGFNVESSISIDEFAVISVVGGLLASLFVVVIALGLAAGSVRFGWNPDNVTAPLVTAAGDAITLPALLVAVPLVNHSGLAPTLAALLGAITVVGLVVTLRLRRPSIHQIMRESIPVLAVAIVLDLVAGVTVEKQREDLAALPVLLVLLPGYLAAAGALGGILSSRLSSKLHLGLTRAGAVPDRGARVDLRTTLLLALPVYLLVALLSSGAGQLTDLSGPGLADLLAVTLVGGLVATVVVMVVAYYGTMFAVRFNLDPDTYGIPLVTSTLDLVGAFTLVFALEAFDVLP